MARYRIVAAGACLFALGALAQSDLSRGLQVRQILDAGVSIPSYHALVIGINDYQHWQDLRQARNDAEEVAELLTSRYGFASVARLYDAEATRTGIMLALRRLAAQLSEQDALLIFYAGHGYYDKLMNRGYWVPFEAREKVDGEPATMDWLSNTDLKDFIAMTKARHVLVVSDSCFSGSLFRGGTPDLTTKANTWYRRAIAQPSRWAISSGDLEQVPDESAFARKFVSALRYPLEPVFSASDLAGRIKVEVAGDSGAQPLFGRMPMDRDSQFGEFVFLDRSSAGVADGLPASAVREEPSLVNAPVPAPALPSAVPVSPARVSPVPAVSIREAPSVAGERAGRTGVLLISSPADGYVSIDGGELVLIRASQPLRMSDMTVGTHTVKVVVNGKTWGQSVYVGQGSETVIEAFPGEIERMRKEALAAEQAQQRQMDAMLKKELEAQRSFKEDEEKNVKRHRPRVL